MKFIGGVGHGQGTNGLDFGGNADPGPDEGFLNPGQDLDPDVCYYIHAKSHTFRMSLTHFQLTHTFPPAKVLSHAFYFLLVMSFKCTKCIGGWGSAPDPTGGADSTLQDLLTEFFGEGTGSDGKEKRRKYKGNKKWMGLLFRGGSTLRQVGMCPQIQLLPPIFKS